MNLMSYASHLSTTPTIQHESSVYTPIRSWIRHAIFSQTAQHDWYITWPRYGSLGSKCFSQGHNDTLPSSGTEPRADKLAVANLRSYPPSCTAASWNNSVFFPKKAIARYAQCGH